ncbi:MAG: hypothetical protein ACE5LV_07260 [Candidatus Aminicenantales bacterium]
MIPGLRVFFSLAFVLCLLFFHTASGDKRGAEIVVQRLDGRQVSGELIAVKKDALLVVDSESGADVTVCGTEIQLIHILEVPKTGLGALSGLLVGSAVGVAATSTGNDCNRCPNDKNRALIGGVLIGGIGALIGAIIGSTTGKNEILLVQNLSEEERARLWERLRPKARMPNFR